MAAILEKWHPNGRIQAAKGKQEKPATSEVSVQFFMLVSRHDGGNLKSEIKHECETFRCFYTREEVSFGSMSSYSQLYLKHKAMCNQAAKKKEKKATVMTTDLTCFFSLPSLSVQCMFYRPPRPKKACGVCLKVSCSIFSRCVHVCGEHEQAKISQSEGAVQNNSALLQFFALFCLQLTNMMFF